MYKLIETSEILNINTAEGVSFAQLEKVERKVGTPKYTQETFVSAAFKRHILNESSSFGKSIAIMDDDGNATKTTYFSIADNVEKVTHTFVKQ